MAFLERDFEGIDYKHLEYYIPHIDTVVSYDRSINLGEIPL